jgi:hypothetical protein
LFSAALSSSASSGADSGECEYPLDNTCPKNEECYLPKHTHSRVGTCQCKDGYHRDSTKTCVAIATKGNTSEDLYLCSILYIDCMVGREI